MPPLPPKITFLNDTAKLNPLAAAMRGLAYAGQHADSVFGNGSLDVQRYGHVLQVAAARRRARRGRGVRRAALRHVGDHDDEARRVHADVLARAQRPALDPPVGARMTMSLTERPVAREEVLRQVPRHRDQQRRSDADRAHPGDRPRRLGRHPDVVGDAVPAGRRASTPASSPCRRSAPACGSSSSRATPTSRSGSAATGAPPPRCRCSRTPCRPAVNGFTIQTTLKNGIVVIRRPRPDRRHPDPDDDRRDDLGQRRRDRDLERQGRGHLDARADDATSTRAR